ncbi:MAG: esterase [Lachnospiraceae bacterium]|nr:esterase [Lachnospiraceae bacterium]
MEILEFGNKEAEAVLIQPIDDHDCGLIEREVSLIREFSKKNFLLAAFKVNDWNKDLSPWKAPAVFGKEDFGEGAEETLREILDYCSDKTRKYYVGGYSLAALFALWAVTRTDVFQGAACASPSLWFPGFEAYVKGHKILTGKVYLSLGDREEKTRNPVMATVGDRVRAMHALLSDQSVDCVLQWNEGNHFRDSDLRTAKAFAWVLRETD